MPLGKCKEMTPSLPVIKSTVATIKIRHHSFVNHVLRFTPHLFFLILFYFLTLQYCIGFAINQNESATGIHVFPKSTRHKKSIVLVALCSNGR